MSSVDVIVPCYRYGHFLKECVESILAQSLTTVRVVIIDDASPDNTREIGEDLARSDSRVTLIRHKSNKGHIATYNEGIEWCQSDYLLVLSADDYLLPDALRRAADLMDKHPEIAFSFGNAINLEPSGVSRPVEPVICKPESSIVSGIKFIEITGVKNIVPTPTAVVRTDIQKRVGGYRPELTHSGDMEMWLRLAAHGSVGMLRSYQAVYRLHATNMSHGYKVDGALPDIKQRKAAVDCFFQSCGHLLPKSAQMHRKFNRLIAEESISLASAAFNESEIQDSEKLCTYAREVCSTVIPWSLQWTKLACKRMIGREAWRVLQPAVRACDRRRHG